MKIKELVSELLKQNQENEVTIAFFDNEDINDDVNTYIAYKTVDKIENGVFSLRARCFLSIEDVISLRAAKYQPNVSEYCTAILLK